MVDGVLLVVDSVEGPKPQTRFVLKKVCIHVYVCGWIYACMYVCVYLCMYAGMSIWKSS